MKKTLREFDFDVSDADSVGKNVGPHRPGGVRRKAADPKNPQPKMNPTSHLPGLPPERRKNEATPFGGPQKDPQQQPQQQQGRRRAGTPTSQFQMRPDTPLQKSAAPTPKTDPGESAWDVYVDGAGVYKVPAGSEEEAKNRASEWLNGGGDPETQGKQFGPESFQAVRGEGTTGANLGAGPQMSLDKEGLERLREMVNNRIKEIVRKKSGGGGYNLYSPNKGKKKNPKPVGEFPTRLAAKRAELARFPPKDPETLKKARKRLDKLSKDPKKRIEKEKEEMKSKGVKRSGRPAGARKAKKEAIVQAIANSLSERLFREEELPGSPWDERIGGLNPDALAQDKKLAKHHKDMELASHGALGDGHKALAKALRGVARVNPGDVMRDEDHGKMFMPIMLDVDGAEVGPVHLYIDGGHVCIEVSKEAREAIAGLEPPQAKDLRGGLMSFQEDHLPKIDKAKRAWDDRDSHLDKLHQRLEKMVGGLSPVEVHLAKQLMNRRKR